VRELGGEDPLRFAWASLRYPHVAALRARFAERLAPATTNKILAAVKGVLREAMRLGQLSAEDCARACDVRGVRGSREPAGRALEPHEMAALFRACRPGTRKANQAALGEAGPSRRELEVGRAEGARDAALLALLYGAGLRRAEVVALDVGQFNRESGALKLVGKGNKERSPYVAPGGVRALRAWLDVRGAAPGPLLVRVHRGDHASTKRLSDRSAAKILTRIAQRANLAAPISPHDMRRTFVGDLLDTGADLVVVQKLAGHAQITTTARYDRRPEKAKVRAVERLQVPYEEASA
jgi:site-specific recombinase XerD